MCEQDLKRVIEKVLGRHIPGGDFNYNKLVQGDPAMIRDEILDAVYGYFNDQDDMAEHGGDVIDIYLEKLEEGIDEVINKISRVKKVAKKLQKEFKIV